METEHLMMNDLVYYNEKPIRLKDLWENFLQNLQTKDNENHQDKHVVWDFGSDKSSPINLTEEILLKSGFVRTGRTDEVSFRYSKATDDYYSRVEIRPRINGEFFVRAEKYAVGFNQSRYSREFKGRISFLHELQHILRLTGIEKEVKIC